MKRKIILIVSLAVGLLAAVLTRLYVAAKEAEVRGRIAQLNSRYGTIWALSFKKDTPAGTVLTRGDLMLLEVPERGMRGQALTEEHLKDALGRKTLLGHRAKDVLFWSDLEGGDPRSTGLSADIKGTMRAMSVNCSGAAAVSGMVRPNDHVDVIGTFAFPGADGKLRSGDVVTLTILQNVLVLATGQRTAKTRGEDPFGRNYATVTLEVTPREAEMLAFTEQMKGRLVLTLRNRNSTHFERELPEVNFDKVKSEMEQLNLQRQQTKGGGRRP